MYGYGYKYVNGLVVGSGGAPPVPPFANTKSLSFDGVDDNLYIPTSLNLGTNSTISMWIKRGRTSAIEVMLGATSYTSFYYLFEIGPANQLYFRINTAYLTFQSAAISSIMSDTVNWINICFVRSGNSVELFLNGNSMQVLTGVGSVIDTRFDRIGSWYNYTYAFLGNIDEVSAYNRAVTPAEIVTLSTAPTVDLTSLSPLAWYRNGDGDTYPTITDNGSGGNSGTMTNMDAGDIENVVPN